MRNTPANRQIGFVPRRSRLLCRGFTLIEMGFVLAIVGLLMVAGGRLILDSVKTDKSSAFGDEAIAILGASNTYLAGNFEAIIAGSAIPGVPAPFAPTVANLQTLGVLPAGMSPTNSQGSGWNIVLLKQPAACVAAACDVSIFINTTAPVIGVSGVPDTKLLSQVMDRVGANAGMSTVETPGTIAGQNAGWTQANPLGNVAGVLGLRGGYGSSGYSQYIRMGDSRNVTLSGGLTVSGAPGVSVTGGVSASSVAAAGAITSSSATIAAINGTTITGATVTGTTFTGTTMNGTTGNFTGSVSTPYVNYASSVIGGAACTPNGTVGSDASGYMYACMSGVWVSTSQGTCTHGGWSATTPGTYSVYLPSFCTSITVSASGGGGGSGYSGAGQGCSPYDWTICKGWSSPNALSAYGQMASWTCCDYYGNSYLTGQIAPGGGGGGAGQSRSNVVVTVISNVHLSITVGGGGSQYYDTYYATWSSYAYASGSSGGATTIVDSGVTVFSAAGGGLGGGACNWNADCTVPGAGGAGYPSGSAGGAAILNYDPYYSGLPGTGGNNGSGYGAGGTNASGAGGYINVTW